MIQKFARFFLLYPSIFLAHAGLLPIWGQEFDIAIIGGGINGVYTGVKLLEKDSLHPIALFEATDRIGGRLYTMYFPGMENIPVELGAMRLRADHKRVQKLAQELGLTLVPFEEEVTDNFVYLRGTQLRESELTDPGKLPYKLSQEEEGKSPEQIYHSAILKLFPEFDSLTQEEWEEKKTTWTFRGRPLKDVSWMNAISSALSPEAFQLLTDLGFLSLVFDENTLAVLNLQRPSEKAAFLKIQEGYQSLPLRLANRFKDLGGQVRLQHTLIRIERSKEKKRNYRLIFEDEKGKEISYSARKILLTISPHALLKLLDATPFLNTPVCRKQIESVFPKVLTKLFFAYSSPWWRELNVRGGSSITSLPIRGCFYFSSEIDLPQAKKGSQKSLLLASYQGSFTSLWRSLNSSPYTFPPPTQVGYRAIEQAQEELSLVHGTKIPEPIATAFQDWGKPPYYAAYYGWNVGADPAAIHRKVRKPLTEEEIYIFTSDFCEDQGWVECALEVSDYMLGLYFR